MSDNLIDNVQKMDEMEKETIKSLGSDLKRLKIETQTIFSVKKYYGKMFFYWYYDIRPW